MQLPHIWQGHGQEGDVCNDVRYGDADEEFVNVNAATFLLGVPHGANRHACEDGCTFLEQYVRTVLDRAPLIQETYHVDQPDADEAGHNVQWPSEALHLKDASIIEQDGELGRSNGQWVQNLENI